MKRLLSMLLRRSPEAPEPVIESESEYFQRLRQELKSKNLAVRQQALQRLQAMPMDIKERYNKWIEAPHKKQDEKHKETGTFVYDMRLLARHPEEAARATLSPSQRAQLEQYKAQLYRNSRDAGSQLKKNAARRSYDRAKVEARRDNNNDDDDDEDDDDDLRVRP